MCFQKLRLPPSHIHLWGKIFLEFHFITSRKIPRDQPSNCRIRAEIQGWKHRIGGERDLIARYFVEVAQLLGCGERRC